MRFGFKQKKIDHTKDIGPAKDLKEKIRILQNKISNLDKEKLFLLESLPNIPMDDVPDGDDESGNVVLRKCGNLPDFNFSPKDHVELGEGLGLIDTQTAAEVSGSRFSYLFGDAALLELALVSYAVRVLTDEEVIKKIGQQVCPDYPVGTFTPVVPPQMIRPEVFKRMGRLEPKEERYHIPSDDLYLIGSAEHTLGPMFMDKIIPESKLPLRFVGFSTSFRREAGSYGKDTRGILRVHQFDKLEMESFTIPADSEKEQKFIVGIQEYLMTSLGLPYQVVSICTGDMGAPDARQIDLETWMPGQGRYRETHTSDLMTDYQSRRLNTRYKSKDGALHYVHMNDATAIAVGRIIVAILENYQTAEGKVEVPALLQSFLGKKIIG